jgi:hypothetical protein
LTNLDFVSQITAILKSNNKDNRIPKRAILAIARDSATFLVAQKLMDRTISQETSLYSTIECFEFEKVEAKRCPSVEFRLCKTLMKSVKPLPKLIFSRLGASIKQIVSLDGEFSFSFVDDAQYRRNKKRQHQIKDQVFIYLGADNHLYIPDREIYSLDITLLTLDKAAAEECSSCGDNSENGSNNGSGGCKNLWNEDFICPDKLVEIVKNTVLQRVSTARQITADNNPNGIENG